MDRVSFEKLSYIAFDALIILKVARVSFEKLSYLTFDALTRLLRALIASSVPIIFQVEETPMFASIFELSVL